MDAGRRRAATKSIQRTAKSGHRTLDVLHVATAVHLGAKEFLSFDIRQKKLARHAGLKVPF
jgi:predicted nucleic acid-binding protein